MAQIGGMDIDSKPETLSIEELSSSDAASNKVEITRSFAPGYPTSNTSTISTLPNELLVHILDFLDTPRPSATALFDEPHFNLTKSEVIPLKSASAVCKRWRRAAMPILFKNAQFVCDGPRTKRLRLTETGLETLILPFYNFISQNYLQKFIESFTLIIRSPYEANYATDSEVAAFWKYLFDIIDPADLLIVAVAERLGSLTLCDVYTTDAWNFDSPCHYLHLQKPKNTIVGSTSQGLVSSTSSASSVQADVPQRASFNLFSYRPWSKLLLNEGSFIRAFATYEFWLRRAPSIMPNLVGAEDYQPLIGPTISDISYIGIFPMSNHFGNLAENIPRIDRLYVQLVPRNDILQDASRMVNVEIEDLWMERNACYAALMRQLFNAPPLDNYKYLKVFESGDAADREAWLMAVEYVKRANNGWKVVGDGVFAKDPQDLVPETETDYAEGTEGSTFEGALIRWTWNGTTNLPVSAFPLYDSPVGPLP